MLDEGFWAEIKIGSEQLRLFSERSALGVQASVYDVVRKCWIAPSEAVENIEQGKEKAVEYAVAHLRQAGHIALPTLLWKGSISLRCYRMSASSPTVADRFAPVGPASVQASCRSSFRLLLVINCTFCAWVTIMCLQGFADLCTS